MKFLRFSHLITSFLVASTLPVLAAQEPDPGAVEMSVARMLEQAHYSQKALDDKVAQQFLKNYLDALDYNHMYFTQKDVDAMTAKYSDKLARDILGGIPDPAFKIFKLYKQRVEERIAFAKGLLKNEFDFTGDKTVEVNRQKLPWPKDEAEADKIWTDRVQGEVLQESLSKQEKEPIARITKRYDQMLRNLREQTNEDIMKGFLSTLAQTYDPHSDYMSRSELENFSINMRLSLVGIGAQLQSDEGYAKIMELVPGGPAAKDNRLKVGDRITAVAQGDKEFVDTVDMKLDKVVEMIRGKKDSVVRLQIIPVSASDPGMRKVIDIRRDEIRLKEQEAKAEIIERPGPGGTTQRLGWIVLPSFYADMDRSGSANAKSTTKDVLALINRLKAEGITGLVMDLRRNGGGSLEEAVNLTGLFIKRGPVVQSKDHKGNISVSKDRDPSVAWDGPMLVVCNRLSASASEIFAAALQDYNRAVVVGDPNTFGKGTVQTMLEIGRIMSFIGSGNNDAGALKLTIQKFYRVAGGSTQLRGVESDIRLPSPYDHPEIGESSLKSPLPYDVVAEASGVEKLEKPLHKPELKSRSTARVAADLEFRYITEDLERVKQRRAENKISLNEKLRRAELEQEKARKESRIAERAKVKPPEQKVFSLTLENLAKPELQLVTAKEDEKPGDVAAKGAEPLGETVASEDPLEDEEDLTGTRKKGVDPVKNETLSILHDLIELQRGGSTGTTASASVSK